MRLTRWLPFFCVLALAACAESHFLGTGPGIMLVDASARDASLIGRDLGVVRMDGSMPIPDGSAPPDHDTPDPDLGLGPDLATIDAGTWCDATAAGCGTVDAGPILSWDAFLTTASSQICDASMRCDGHMSLRYGMLFCQPRYIETIPLLPGGGDTRPPFDPVAAQACIDALARATSCIAFSGALTVCDPLFYPRGTVASGAPCAVDYDCANGHCDRSADLLCEGGRCVAWVAPGEMCAASRECPPGLGCTGGVCAPPGSAGSSCVDDVSCAQGLFCGAGTCAPPQPAMAGCFSDFACDDSLVCTGGCVAGLAPGASCSGGIGLGMALCAIGTTCSIGHCRARSAIGGSCRFNEDCPYNSGQCFHGTCVARPTIGDACSASGPQCIFSACVAGVCAQFDVGGGPCNDGGGDRCLRGLYCDPGTHVCIRYATDGGDCSAARCAAGLTCNPGTRTCGVCL